MDKRLHKRKSPILAAVLGGIHPFGFLYFGWRVALCVWLSWGIAAACILLLRIEKVPPFSGLAQSGVLALFAYAVAQMKNKRAGSAATALLIGGALFPWICTVTVAIASFKLLGDSIAAHSLRLAGAAAIGCLFMTPMTFLLTGTFTFWSTRPLTLMILATNHAADEEFATEVSGE